MKYISKESPSPHGELTDQNTQWCFICHSAYISSPINVEGVLKTALCVHLSHKVISELFGIGLGGGQNSNMQPFKLYTLGRRLIEHVLYKRCIADENCFLIVWG